MANACISIPSFSGKKKNYSLMVFIFIAKLLALWNPGVLYSSWFTTQSHPPPSSTASEPNLLLTVLVYVRRSESIHEILTFGLLCLLMTSIWLGHNTYHYPGASVAEFVFPRWGILGRSCRYSAICGWRFKPNSGNRKHQSRWEFACWPRHPEIDEERRDDIQTVDRWTFRILVDGKRLS